MIDGTPPDEGLEIIGGELADEEWDDMKNEQDKNNLDENGSKSVNVVDDVEEHENVDETEASGDQAGPAASSSVQESETASLEPKIKADLECLSRIGCVVDIEKKQSSVKLLPFLVKVENILAKERQRCKAQAKAKKSIANMTNGNDIVDDITGKTVKSIQKRHSLKMSNALLSSIMSSTISFSIFIYKRK